MYSVDILNKGGSSFTVCSEGHEFTVDTKGKGVSPSTVLLASLGSCVGAYVQKYAEGTKLNLTGFKISVKADFEKDPRVRFKDINISIEIEGLILDERRKEALLNFVKKCPVHNTLKSDPQINISLI